jgi:hypothetical protein
MTLSNFRGCKNAVLLAVLAVCASVPAQAASMKGAVGARTMAVHNALLDFSHSDQANSGRNKDACQPERRPCKKVTVAEGGSIASYLMLSGLLCFAAIASRSRKTVA